MPRDTSPRVSARFRVFCNFPVHRHDKVLPFFRHARRGLHRQFFHHRLPPCSWSDFESSMLRIPKPWISIQRLCTCSKSSIVMGRIVKFVSFMLFFIFLAVCLSGAVFYKTASHAVHLGRMAAPQPLMGTSEQDLILPPHRSQIRGSYSALPGRLHL